VTAKRELAVSDAVNYIHTGSTGFDVGFSLRRGNVPPNLPNAGFPPLSRCHVYDPGVVCDWNCRSRHSKVRAGNRQSSNESKLDAFDGDVQLGRCCIIRNKSTSTNTSSNMAQLYDCCQVPEKLKPGSFDTCGSSHQILHFMVILRRTGTYGWTVQSLRLCSYRRHLIWNAPWSVVSGAVMKRY